MHAGMPKRKAGIENETTVSLSKKAKLVEDVPRRIVRLPFFRKLALSSIATIDDQPCLLAESREDMEAIQKERQ